MVSFAKFLQESSPDGYDDGIFVLTKGHIKLHFARETTEKDNKDYIKFLSAVPTKMANPEEKKLANYINQFGKNCNLFPSKKFEHKSVKDVVRFIKGASFKEIYDEIYRLRNSKRQMFTKNDIKFNEDYNSLVDQDICNTQEDGSIQFPLTGKEIRQVETPEEYESLKEYLDKIQKDFEDKANLVQIHENLNESEEQSSEDGISDEGDAEKDYEWQKREKTVAKNIDLAINEFKDKHGIQKDSGARVVGGGNKSDVLVSSGENREFFVEVKLNYEKAAYLKFNIKYDGKNIVRTKNDKDESDFNREFSTQMTNILAGNLKKKFEELKKRVRFWIDSFREVTKDNKRITDSVLIDDKNAERFPDAFDELAKAFNFFILEWTKNFKVCKSNYVYNTLNHNEKEASNVVEIAKRIVEKLKTLSNGQKITEMDAFQKFRSMYTKFISTEKTQVTEENRYVLFSFDTHEFEGSKFKNADSKVRDNLIELIEQYYMNKRGVEYIQVDDDLYKIKDNDPFNLKVPKFDNLKGMYQKSGQEKSIIKMDVRIVGADTLHLDMRLTKPKRIKTQKSFVGEHGNLFTSEDVENSSFGHEISGKTNDNLKEKEDAGRRNEDIADKV